MNVQDSAQRFFSAFDRAGMAYKFPIVPDWQRLIFHLLPLRVRVVDVVIMP
jgi:hypothetical protein